MENLFSREGVETTTNRLNKLTFNAERKWGEMTPAQMLAHCNVAYDIVYAPEKYEKDQPKGLKKFLLTLLVKGIVVGEKPYSKNGRTAPQFLITIEKDFDKEKNRMIDYLNKTLDLGATHFEGKESYSFGALTAQEWNTMFAKHLDHHLKQFGV